MKKFTLIFVFLCLAVCAARFHRRPHVKKTQPHAKPGKCKSLHEDAERFCALHLPVLQSLLSLTLRGWEGRRGKCGRTSKCDRARTCSGGSTTRSTLKVTSTDQSSSGFRFAQLHNYFCMLIFRTKIGMK